MTPQIAVIIPARLHSSRLPEKPLALLGSTPLIGHVVQQARKALSPYPSIPIIVACDDPRIADVATAYGAECVDTERDLQSGTERVYQAACRLGRPLDYVINLQGDAPFIPASALHQLIHGCLSQQHPYMTCATRLDWEALHAFREHKKRSPSSGTTAILVHDKGLWFSKQIIPAIRDEDTLKALSPWSPVWRHLGIYAYHIDFLTQYVAWPQGYYESIESLEQLRALEQGHPPTVFPVTVDQRHYFSIDTPTDLERAQELCV